MDWLIPEIRLRDGARDTMLDALSVGCSAETVDSGQLRYVFERDLQARARPIERDLIVNNGGWADLPAVGAA